MLTGLVPLMRYTVEHRFQKRTMSFRNEEPPGYRRLRCSSCGGKTISTRPARAYRAPLRVLMIDRDRPRGRKCGRSSTRKEAAAHP